MSLIKQSNSNTAPKKTVLQENNLTIQDVEVLLRMLSTAHIPVKDIQPGYEAIIKLYNIKDQLRDGES